MFATKRVAEETELIQPDPAGAPVYRVRTAHVLLAVGLAVVATACTAAGLGVWTKADFFTLSDDARRTELSERGLPFDGYKVGNFVGLLLFAIGWTLAPLVASAYPAMTELETCIRISMLGVLAGAFVPTEIGRASCRERVFGRV